MANISKIDNTRYIIDETVFTPEKAAFGDVIVACDQLNSGTYYIVTDFKDIRSDGGYSAFSGRINGVPYFFRRDGYTEDARYKLCTVTDAINPVSLQRLIQTATGSGGALTINDTVTATEAGTNSTTNKKSFSQLNVLEEMALSSLNGLIQNVKDVEPWNINSAKIRLLVDKSFDFAYEFFKRSWDERNLDVIETQVDPGGDDPNTGGIPDTPAETYRWIITKLRLLKYGTSSYNLVQEATWDGTGNDSSLTVKYTVENEEEDPSTVDLVVVNVPSVDLSVLINSSATLNAQNSQLTLNPVPNPEPAGGYTAPETSTWFKHPSSTNHSTLESSVYADLVYPCDCNPVSMVLTPKNNSTLFESKTIGTIDVGFKIHPAGEDENDPTILEICPLEQFEIQVIFTAYNGSGPVSGVLPATEYIRIQKQAVTQYNVTYEDD